MKEEKCSHVVIGDNSKCEVKGVGKVRLKLNDGAEKVPTNVKFISKIKKNFIFVGVLDGL